MFPPAAALQTFLLIVFTLTGAQQMTVTPDRGATVTISSSQVTGCKVCRVAGRSRQCDKSLQLRDSTSVSVDFQCPTPKDVFSVKIVQNIGCTSKLCDGHIIQTDSYSDLLEFNRTFTWNLRAERPNAFKIDFSSTGLRQIDPSERCPDGHSYTLEAFQTTGKVRVGKYCKTGPIQSAQMLNQGSFSLEVPGGQKLQSGQFQVSVGEEIKSLAKITLMLPKGSSSTELLPANYPGSFPDDDVMEWYFQVPDKHTTSVEVLKLRQPQCLKKETALEYHNKGRAATVLSLTEPQPDQSRGHFTLMLRNCEMDRRRAGSPGLSLNLRVSTSSTSSPVSCKVDLSRMNYVSLHIEKLRPTSDCEMKINSVLTENITVTSNSDLTFQDCHPEDIQVTAMKVIECHQFTDCPKNVVPLAVPPLPTCFPAPLSSMTWSLRPPLHGTVELTSSSGFLKQSLPGQPCNDSVIIEVAEDGGAAFGQFCSQGAIQKVQIHTNVSVKVSGMEAKTQRTASKGLLNARFKEEIPERYIFTVSPKRDTPVLLATPGWPVGMKSYATVSWIVSVPPKMEAHLMFANLSQPKCSNRHTNIRVQRVGCPEEDYSRREDEEAESEITVSESFYLNMSNCMPEIGDFSVVTKITLQKSQNLLLTIILSVVAVLLVIFIVVLVVVCVVVRKKKKKLDHQVSIYNPNGTIFLPGHNGFPKTQEDEYHEYASIEDTLVYTHLLKKAKDMGVYGEVDTYRPFTGHTDSQKPLVSNGAADNMQVGTYQQFQASSQQAPPLPVRPPSHSQILVDNDVYQTEDQSEGEHSPNLGPRLEPEGGD